MTRAKIFYLDDEKELLEFVQFVLERNKYEVKVTDSWDDSFINELKDMDMFIIDIMINGEAEGYNICKKLKETSELKMIPLYMFSAKAFEEDRIEAIKAGADGFIEKPISIEELLKVIENVAETFRKNKSVERE